MEPEAIGVIIASIISVLGARDLIKLYILKIEGCGGKRCNMAVNKHLEKKITSPSSILGKS